MTIGIDSSLLLAIYQSRSSQGLTGLAAGGGASGQAATNAKVAPTAPWLLGPDAITATTNAAVKQALLGHKLVDESAAQLDLPGASADYRKLFALYQGLSTLNGVASEMNNKGLTSADKARINTTFTNGLAEISKYVDTAKFDNLRLTDGDAMTSAKSAVTIQKSKTAYVTPPLATSTTTEPAAFQGDVQFNIAITRIGVTSNIPIDLAGMGAQPRTIGNVVNYINDQLAMSGNATRFATQRIPGAPRTIQVGGKTVTLPATSDQWTLKVTPGVGEAVTFSAPATAGAVYVAQTIGNPDPDKNPTTADGVTPSQLLKFQTDTSTVPPPLQTPGEANWVDGRAFAETLGPEVKTVHATKVGPDGSVYVLADVTAATGGQTIKGSQDVALLKYDTAGQLIYTRTLGASGSASGLGLAVSADGQIAVAGSLTGALNGAQEGALNSGPTGALASSTDSFVTLYNADGEEQWTERRGARQDDDASQVAFGADGTVYVAGRAKSVMPGATAIGGYDSYIEGFKADSTGKVQTLFTQTFGTTAADRPAGLVVDGNALVTASVEDGHAVLRRFDLSGGAPALASTRDLGDLQGGDIAGLALDGGDVVLAGSTANTALGGVTVTNANAGGVDAFAMRLSADLSAGAGDAIAYYGGTGDDRATALSVAGGKVYLGGSAGTDLPGQAPVGTKDGFLANIDIATGAVDWSRRFTGKDGYAAPTAIAADPAGASVLDRLGLPTGTLDLSDSQRITAQSAVRGGDTFTIKAGTGSTATVTISEDDTLDTLAQKIRRASGFQANVSLTTVAGVRSLTVKPLNDRMTVEIGPGKADKDALATLGIPQGVVRATTINDAGKSVPADGKSMLYGLGLPNDLKLTTTSDVAHVLAQVATAMGIVRTAYKDLVAAASPQSAQAAAAPTGPVPAYLTAQIKNYQDGLARLTGGQ